MGVSPVKIQFRSNARIIQAQSFSTKLNFNSRLNCIFLTLICYSMYNYCAPQNQFVLAITINFKIKGSL